MTTPFCRRLGIGCIAAILLLPLAAIAQPANPPLGDQEAVDQNAGDPPARVGRLGYIEGQVSEFGVGGADWTEAQLNFPVTNDTAFATGADGRAEFELGAALARIDFGTELDVIKLDEGNTDLRLPQGMIAIDLPSPPDDLPGANTVVTTPRGDAALAAPGHYFIAAGAENAPTIVTVIDGGAQVTDAANATFTIAAGQSGTLTGDTNQPAFAISQPLLGPFAAWVRHRDDVLAAAAAPPPSVSPQITGVAVLGAYGGWQTEPTYGPVWFPRELRSDWAPYREGHWAYVRPWGWTWVDNEPWGFAPFHYGRWIRVHNRWGWAPGAVAAGGPVAPPTYAPALVVFASVGGGRPGVAWYPLGWNEPYIPPYRVSRGYIEHVNYRVVDRPRIVQVNNIYNNIYVRGGNYDPYRELHVGTNRDHAVAVPRTAFQGARPVTQAAFKPPAKALQPAIRPAAVTPPTQAPKPKLATAEPPKPKILPAANRAPIPQKLMAPKPSPAIRPATATSPLPKPEARPGTPPVRPAVVRPEGKPQGQPPTKPAVVTPPPARPEAKPPTKPATMRPEARPPVRPETRPAVVRPEARPQAQPPTKPAVATPPSARPEAKPPTKPTVMRPETRPPARPESRPAVVRPETRPPVRTESRPAVVQPEAKPPAHPSRPAVAPQQPQTQREHRPTAQPAVSRPAHPPEAKPQPRAAAPHPAPHPAPAANTEKPKAPEKKEPGQPQH